MTTTTFGRLVRSQALWAALSVSAAVPPPAAFAQADPLANCLYYTRTQADFEQGLKHCREAIQKYPEDPEARFYGALCLAETGHWDEAWQSFSWLIERKGSEDKKVRKHADMADKQALFYYQTHFNRGLELVEAQSYEEADGEFAIATKIYPSKVDAYLNRGFAQTQRDDLDGALASFDTAVSIDPKHPQTSLYYWDALNRKLKVLRNAEPRDSTAIEGTMEKLRTTLDRVLETPDVKAEDRAAAYLQLADLAFANGENEKAIEYVTKATEIAPEKITELYNMGIEFYNADDYGPAIQALRTVMAQIDDESDDIWRRALYVVGLCSLYTEDWAGCIAAMDKLIALDPGNMDYYLNRGKAHMKAGNESAAAADITKWEKMKEAAVTGSSE
jgi:tetratricopeptide (TPR) repeat protein